MSELDQAVSAFRRSLIGILAISAITTILMLALPFYMTQVFTHVLPSRSVETLLALSVLALIAYVLYGIFDGLRQSILARVAARYEALLSGPIVYSHFMDAGRDSSSGLELLQDVRQVRSFVGSRALAAVSEAPFIPLFMAILYLVDTTMGLMITAGMALMVLLALVQQSVMKSGVEAQNNASRAANRVLQAHIEQSETVRVLGLQKIALDRWGVPNARAVTSFIDLQSLGAFYGGVSKFLRFSLQSAILGFGAFLAIEGDISSTVVFACMMIGGRALAPLDGLVGSWSSLTTAWESHKRVRDALTGFYMEPERTALPEPAGAIQVEKLIYGMSGQSEPIIKRISFGFQAGESIAIIGPSGAGKSTLLRLMVGALAPASGTIRLDGADLRQWDRLQLGRHIGYVPQSVDFLPGTVADNIARFDPERDDAEVVAAARQAGIHELILRFPQGYNTPLGRGAFAPSGGQKQLLAVARAFYRNPKLLFFDEPNSNLDQQGDHLLMQAIGQARKRGATVVLVTQRPSLLQVADKVLVMRDGLIDNFGPRNEVLPKVVKPAAVQQQPQKRQAIEQKDGSVPAVNAGS
ncbi:type I secretion system permease/ATPase [Aurantimonas sp. VKM B-3413]|uniref:type I secretion system permease/ATPase n=1 Tax=Aurantimonas sp. VKM B-3413 TaxID=2779401 RepID=UPI001E45385F|nr:type I secretion system permease/ATPase [Aurantimonas sp. VKM B-3413]MCB8839386.1 type I secretion system permease/ATPase [Aurantimonas sp. VKM B-3413]